MIEFKAPQDTSKVDKSIPTIFLAGSIEEGTAEAWQSKVTQSLEEDKVILFNPRRDDWDSTWEQKIENLQFLEQVTWELSHIEKSDITIVYFDKNTKSPISLLELGLVSQTDKKIIVFCPDGFFRKGNVDIVCKRYNLTQVDSFEELIKKVKEYLSNF